MESRILAVCILQAQQAFSVPD